MELKKGTLIVAAAIGTVLMVASAAVFLPGDEAHVQIEFGMAPDLLEGTVVLVDGEAVGRLERIGRATRNAFAVSTGEHEISLDHPEMETQPIRVEIERRAQKIRLMVEATETWADGRTARRIVFR